VKIEILGLEALPMKKTEAAKIATGTRREMRAIAQRENIYSLG
jgi:hypothetical protein